MTDNLDKNRPTNEATDGPVNGATDGPVNGAADPGKIQDHFDLFTTDRYQELFAN
ncbi:MAG: hypothetical protein ACFB16_18650 [Phormidesmis sp.]